jgi:hypothetical protein
VVVPHIPALWNGKPDRIAMKAMAAEEWPRG